MDQVTKDIDQLVVDVKKTVEEDVSNSKEEVTVETVEVETKEAKDDTEDTKEVKEDDTEKDDKATACVLEESKELNIGFTVPYDDGYTSPYIDLGSGFMRSFDHCLDKDEIVLSSEMIVNLTDDNKMVTLWLDYPLDDEYSFKIYPEDASKGFSRGHLLKEIKRTYDRLYVEEEETSSRPVENIPGMLNRATTDGNYGVWGHALDDLVLHRISYDAEKNEIWLGIDS